MGAREEFERDMARLDWMIANVHTLEIPPDMLVLAEQALASLDARKDEDVKTWAAGLAQSMVELPPEPPGICLEYSPVDEAWVARANGRRLAHGATVAEALHELAIALELEAEHAR